jgi:hypothetical protein
VLRGERLHPLRAAADQDRVRHHARAVGQAHAALLADRLHRADQVLVQAHAAGDAVHHDAESSGAHPGRSPLRCNSLVNNFPVRGGPGQPLSGATDRG